MAPTEKMEAHSLTPIEGCGFNASCPSDGLLVLSAAMAAIILAVVITMVWIVGGRLIRGRRRGAKSRAQAPTP